MFQISFSFSLLFPLHKRNSIILGMRQAYRQTPKAPVAPARAAAAPCNWSAGSLVGLADYLDLPPADIPDAGPQSFGRRFLGGPARGQGTDPSVT